MKNQSTKIIVIILFLFSYGCTHSQAVVFHPLPSVTVDGERAWNVLIETIKTFYQDVEYANKETGEVRSFVLITDKCWAGLVYGGLVPCKTARLVARVSSLSPFKVEIAVQQHKGTPMTNYRKWIEAGNNFTREREIYDALLKKLR